MKRTLIPKIPYTVPRVFEKYLKGAEIFDSSCSPEARVYFIRSERLEKGGFYLKRAKAGSLLREAAMTEYFHSLKLGTEVIECISEGGCDWLMTKAVNGEDCTSSKYLSEPNRLATTTGTLLRALHEMPFELCPVKDRVGEYLALAEKNFRTDNFDKTSFPDSFGYRSADEAYNALTAGKHLLRSEVLIHGDYCLPNVMLDDWRFAAFIDVDHGGVGDRHIDLFWGAWTLFFNLGTNEYRDTFFDAYGRDKINPDALRTVAAAEVFG